MASLNSFHTRTQLTAGGRTHQIFSLPALERAGFSGVARLPYSLKILLENLLRREDGALRRSRGHRGARPAGTSPVKVQKEIAFTPARVLLQDFTGVPAVVDLAAMRDGIVRLGGDPRKVNPLQPVELVIDHSVQVDHYAERNAADLNAALEFARNKERYTFLRWGQEAFDNFRVVPPDTGIVHQVNLEYLARVVFKEESGGELLAYPDTLVGTDSHTTMVNGLGVVGWGVGGIEAEAAMLGQPISMLIPEVVGFRLVDRLPEGATATDLVLTITERLRKLGVVGKFVEFYGPGLEFLTIADRATLGQHVARVRRDDRDLPDRRHDARLSAADRPRRGARQAGRSVREGAGAVPDGAVAGSRLHGDVRTRSLDGRAEPRRPEAAAGSRVAAPGEDEVPAGARGHARGAQAEDRGRRQGRRDNSRRRQRSGCRARRGRRGQRRGAVPGMEGLAHGSVVVAAITSCTNTSNPSVMIGAGLLARNAVRRGLKVKPWVKTSLAPGSLVVTEYLKAAGLLE